MSNFWQSIRRLVRKCVVFFMGASSSDFQWDVDRPERSIELFETFDIQAAKRFIVATPRQVETQNLEDKYRDHFQSYLDDVRFRPSVDWDKVDTNVPLIFGVESDGRRMPLDGRHRLAKALRDGLTEIPFVRLSPAETDAIRSGPRI